MAEKAKKEKEEGVPKSKKNLLLFGALAVVLMVLAGVIVYLLMAKTPSGENFRTVSANAAKPAAASNSMIGPMINIEEFIVNILDGEDTRYLKVAITLEFDKEDATKEVSVRMPQIRDAILLLIGNKTFDELRDLQGKMQLRAELVGRINTIVQRSKVENIYFTDFVIQ
jgi:flagellar protein FliL